MITYTEQSRKGQQRTLYQRRRLNGITESKAAEKAKRIDGKKKKKKDKCKDILVKIPSIRWGKCEGLAMVKSK